MSKSVWEVLSQGSWKKLTSDESAKIQFAQQNSQPYLVLKNETYSLSFTDASNGLLTSVTNSKMTFQIRKMENDIQPTKPTTYGSSTPSFVGLPPYSANNTYYGQDYPSSYHHPTSKQFSSSDVPQNLHPVPQHAQMSGKSTRISSSAAYYGSEAGIPSQIPKSSITISGPPTSSKPHVSHPQRDEISHSPASYTTEAGTPNRIPKSAITISGPPMNPQTGSEHPENARMSSSLAYDNKSAGIRNQTQNSRAMVSGPPTSPQALSAQHPKFDSHLSTAGLGSSLYHAWKATIGSSRPPTQEYEKLLLKLANSSNDEKNKALIGFYESSDAPYATQNFTTDAVSFSGGTFCLDAPIRTKAVSVRELCNTSRYHMEWSCSKGFVSNSAFLSIHPSSGSLAPNERVTITVVGTILSKKVGQMQLLQLVVISLKYAITEPVHSESLLLPFLIHIKGTKDQTRPHWYIGKDELENPSLLKQGSNATLYLTRLFNVNVVKKVFLSQDAYKAELELLQKIDHPNIIRFIGAAAPDSQESFIVLEYCVNGTLPSYYAKQDRHLNFSWALSFSHQLCGAVRALHVAGYIHRDIRCGHVLVTSEGEPRLIDFSLACLDTREGVSAVGTPSKKSFIAPESYCNGVYTKSSDIFSLGMVMLELTARDQQVRTFFDLAVGLVPDVSSHLSNWSPKFSALIYHYCCNSNKSIRPAIETVEKILLRLRSEPN